MARRSPKSPSSPPIPSARANPWKLRALAAVIIAGIAMAAGFYAMQPPAPRPPSAADAPIGGPPGTQNPQPKNPTSLTHNPEPATQNAKLRPPLPDAQVYAPFPDGTKIAAPVTLSAADAPIGGPHPSAAPTSLAPAQLTVGDPANADPMEFAFHPSRFSDPSRTAKSVAPVILSAADPSAADAPIGGPTSPTQPSGHKPQAPVDPYPEALRLERARAFAMSMCLDTQGRLWVGSENTTPGDGTGGVQCYDPSKPPLEAFTQYLSDDSANKLNTQHPELRNSIQGGLGDDNAYALACDHQGRIWVGHLNHGISVFCPSNAGILPAPSSPVGKWQNYEVVAGLTIPTSLNGPLGERIFHITVAPDFVTQGGNPGPSFHDTLTGKDSDMSESVWMCTSAGLAVYFPSTDTWSYITRAEGMPSDQANSLAFGPDGSIYVATQCDGIAIARPADHYANWKQIARTVADVNRESGTPTQSPSPNTLSDELPTTATGTGLPTNLMNDILTTKDGEIFAATTAGLARSKNRGETWVYTRGADYSEKARQSSRGPSTGWAPTEAQLKEDYCSTLSQDNSGAVWVGYRSSGAALVSPHAEDVKTIPGRVMSLLSATGPGVVAAYGSGLTAGRLPAAARPSPQDVSLPLGNLTKDALPILHRHVSPNSSVVPVAFVGEDWQTRGDWVGRYGRQYSNLCAANSPMDDIIPGMIGQKFSLRAAAGSHRKADDFKRSWLEGISSNDGGALWDCFVGVRRQSMWDDHGEAYSPAWEGPDIQINLGLPEGLFRVSLYFEDYDGQTHALSQNGRDLLVTAIDQSGPAARGRVQQFRSGVYEQFFMSGDHSYSLRIARNYSLNAMLTGIFVDRLAGPPSSFDAGPLGVMGQVHYSQPPLPQNLPPELSAIAANWEKPLDPDEIGALSKRIVSNRIFAYRAASTAGAQAASLAAWRWQIPIWTVPDRDEWLGVVRAGWDDYSKSHPISRGRAGSNPIQASNSKEH